MGFGKRTKHKPAKERRSPHVEDWRELGSATLTPRARKYLRVRGISKEVIRINNVRSLTPAETRALWGSKCECEAVLFPFGKAYGVARLLGRKRDKFRSTPAPSRLYEPTFPKGLKVQIADVRGNARVPLIIAEGPTRVLAAISHGIPAIGISGCWNWQKDRKPLPGLLRYEWRKRVVYPMFDADITQNNGVLWPFLLFGDWLVSREAIAVFKPIPTVAGDKTGLDDFLAAKGAKAWAKLSESDWIGNPALEALRLSAMRTTEGGLAELLALQYGDDLRHDSQEEQWYAWNGVLWQRQPRKAPRVQEAVKDTVVWIIREAGKISNKERRNSMLSWGMRCDRKAVIRGALDLASSDPRLQVATAELDQDVHTLGTQSGIVNLRNGKLMPGARDQFITRSVATSFDPEAKCPRWERFVNEIMCKDAEMVAFMQRFVGYLLLGGNPERYLFFLYGVGRNGKSVFIETLLKLMGDYGEPAKSELIMKHRMDRDSESAQPFMLKLRGKRYITASEVGQGMELDAAVVKSLTGGDEITVRGLHAAPVKFTIEGKFVIRCNHRPIIDGADQAIWDRVVEIPFNLRLTEAAQDRHLRETLNAEMAGILNWAIAGCIEYLKHDDLRIPAAVRKQITAYREQMDTVFQWFEERCTKDREARTSTTKLYLSYQNWCEKQSRPERFVFTESQVEFSKRLKARGYKSKHTKTGNKWLGIRLA